LKPEPRVAGFTALGALGLIVGLAASEPAAVAIGAAFLLPVVYGLAAPRPALPTSKLELSHDRLLEGDAVELRLELAAEAPLDWLELKLRVPARSRLLEGAERLVLCLGAGEVRTVRYRIECARWGLYPVGAVQLVGMQRLWMLRSTETRHPTHPLRVYPRVERLRRLLEPLTTRLASGSRPAAARGEGIEFAELREFRSGERVRRINWRASARRGELLVSDRLPERSSEVVLFLDSLTEAASDHESTLDHAVRAVASLVGEYLHRRDRVGLLNWGGELEWVLPSTGARQQYRIVDAVLSSETARLYRWRDPRLIPRRVLPPQSLVVALTPLLDRQVNRALLDLRARGFELALIEVDPLPFAEHARATYGDEVWRVWLLERELIRNRFLRAGVLVGRWSPGTPLAPVVEELTSRR
jgi:uncharacterized protein (DUF58 family)